MARIHESIDINASADAIKRLLVTPAEIVRWYEGVDSVNPSGSYPSVGSTIDGAMKVLAVEIKAKQTVLENTPTMLRYQLEGMASGTQTWTITQSGGASKLEIETEFHLIGGAVGKLAEPAVVAMLGNNARKSLENIKRMAEGK
ncbi:MAG: SRPBCC family protein [Anaerolineae bacterium]